MDNYNQEIFNFLTKSENFEPLIKAVDHFDMVRTEILNRFWNKVLNYVNELKEGNLPNWKAEFYPNIHAKYAHLCLYNIEWEKDNEIPFCIAWENLCYHPYVGFWLNNDLRNEYDLDGIKSAVRLNSSLKGADFILDHQVWWAFYYYSNHNFNERKTLLEILPDQSDEIAKDYAQQLVNLAINFKGEYDSLLKMKK